MDAKQWEVDRAVAQIAKAPTDLAGEPWNSLIWDPVNKRMIAAVENQRAAEKLLFYSLGGDLGLFRTKERKPMTTEVLKYELVGLLKTERVQLPTYASRILGHSRNTMSLSLTTLNLQSAYAAGHGA